MKRYRKRNVRCVGVDEKDQTQNRRTAFLYHFVSSPRMTESPQLESFNLHGLYVQGWWNWSYAVRAEFGGSAVRESSRREKKVKGGVSGRQEKVKKRDMVGGEGWWESPFLGGSLAESLNWYLFVCHHAWLHAHTNTHTHTHTHTHTQNRHTFNRPKHQDTPGLGILLRGWVSRHERKSFEHLVTSIRLPFAQSFPPWRIEPQVYMGAVHTFTQHENSKCKTVLKKGLREL